MREWEALAERLDAPPFLRPDWTSAWMRAFGAGDLRLVESRRGEELVAVLPMLQRRSVLRSPTNWHTPLFGPLGVDSAARSELLASLFAAPETTVALGNFGGAGTGAEEVAAAAREAGRLVVQRQLGRSPYIPLEGDFETYESTLSRNRRKALRRHRRKLEGEGELEFEVHDGRADLERLLEDLFAVEASGWKGERGTAISSRPETQRFYTEVATWAAERGWLRLAFYRLDGRPIACDLALLQGGVWYTLKAGFDEDLRAFGPGALLLRDEIAHCCELGLTRIELLGEEDEFKASWTDCATERFQVRAFRRVPAGAGRWAAIAAAERARPPLRRLKRKLSR
jgi:CelD/BcsL family acetyltransferase involved in cellulose biosynthesis